MLRRRGQDAGLPGLYPHQLRHTFAHEWLAQGGSETDLMRLAGWKSRVMLQRYGASATDARARDAHRRLVVASVAHRGTSGVRQVLGARVSAGKPRRGSTERVLSPQPL